MSITVRSREDALAELHDVVSRRAAAQGEADTLYQRQVELYLECHELDPPVLMKDIARIVAEAAPGFPGGTLVAVSAALTKHKAKLAR